jgi:Domain of unknown function (DUF6249)
MSDFNGINALALLIPILSVTLSLGAVILWILVWHRRKVHELDCRHKERMAAIEKGLELPPESLPQPVQQMPPRARYLLRGLIWLGVGLALTFAVRDWFGSEMGGFGWIAVAVGAAYLIFYFVEGRKTAVLAHEPSPPEIDQTH